MTRKLLIFLSCLSVVLASTEQFLFHEIVPDVLSAPPDDILNVTFPSGVQAELGNDLSISQVSGVPTIGWDYNPDSHYTLVFCDADPPSRVNPEARSFLHWLVVNISGNDVTSGQTLTSLINSHPEPDTGLHRYMFFVYEQPGLVQFDEVINGERKGFSPEAFASKYNLGSAIAGNFYLTENLED